jgi:hypothetical protein
MTKDPLPSEESHEIVEQQKHTDLTKNLDRATELAQKTIKDLYQSSAKLNS